MTPVLACTNGQIMNSIPFSVGVESLLLYPSYTTQLQHKLRRNNLDSWRKTNSNERITLSRAQNVTFESKKSQFGTQKYFSNICSFHEIESWASSKTKQNKKTIEFSFQRHVNTDERKRRFIGYNWKKMDYSVSCFLMKRRRNYEFALLKTTHW